MNLKMLNKGHVLVFGDIILDRYIFHLRDFGMTPADPTTPHVTLITLGVRDLQRALAFYQTLGWQAHPRSDDQIIFFRFSSKIICN